MNPAAAAGTQLLMANRLYLTPMLVGPCVFNQLLFGVTSAVGRSTARPCLYREVAAGQFSLIVDGGDVETAATGAKTATINQPWSGEMLLAGLLPSAAITVSAVQQTAQLKLF